MASTTVSTALSLENPIFTGFVFYSTLCILKMMLMSTLTIRKRLLKKVFANNEDCIGHVANDGEKVKPDFRDQDVERVRRNHLNDLENIVPFVLLGFFYVLINPNRTVALIHFRVFLISRLLHTVCYQIPIPQPSRGLAFLLGFLVNISMAVQIILATYTYYSRL